jgi:small subunit ribosomal protein S20
MAITKSAKKAIRSSAKKRVFNIRRKRAVHSTVKEVITHVGKERNDQDEALKKAYKAIDKAAKHGTIKKNTAARKKSRLVKKLKAGA